MEWEFTPDEVVQGRVDYGLVEFRRDLLEEFRLNMPRENPPAETALLFSIMYDMFYWFATGGSFEEFEQEVGAEPHLSGFLRMVYQHSDANVTMLGAILQRAVMDQIEAGQPLEAALEAVAAYHAQVCRSDTGTLPPVGDPKRVIWMQQAQGVLRR